MEDKPMAMSPSPLPEALKILSAMERVSQAFRTMLWIEGKSWSLNPIQIQILGFLGNQPPQRRRVSMISEAFDLSRASVSETIKSLESRGFLTRKSDPLDTRSSVLSLTEAGMDAATQTSTYAQKLLDSLRQMEVGESRILYGALNRLIRDLNIAGVITIQRMCMRCHYYQELEKGQGHFCHLLKQELQVDALRLDCEEHRPIG